MRIFRETVNRKSILLLKEVPDAVMFNPGSPATHYFFNGYECYGTCLGCANARCMYFDETDIKCSKVENFPYDHNLNVCPVDAITWDSDKGTPIIDNQICIYCGICMRRCPVGAIYFDGYIIKVNACSNANIKEVKTDAEFIWEQNKQIASVIKKPHGGVFIQESDKLVEAAYSKLTHIRNNYHNPIGRNLLIALGCRSAMRRIGDVYTRMDAVYSAVDDSFGAVEIEFGKDTLDASRGILDDIAVLYARYGIEKKDNTALVICLQLPNARQGYWQVVKDINTVEGIRINTLTIGALMILNWNGCLLEPNDNKYYIDYDNMKLRTAIEHQLDGSVNLSEKKLGILEPLK